MQTDPPLSPPTAWRPEFADLGRKLGLLGATDEQLAREVEPAIVHQWLTSVPAFAEAVRAGREQGDAEVKDGLRRSAVGYGHIVVKALMPPGALYPQYMSYPVHRPSAGRDSADEWAALYQQQPVTEGGAYFKAEWIRTYDQLPQNLRKYGASDYAVTAKGGDFTEHGIAGVDSQGDLYLVDWWYGQTQTDVWVEAFLDLAALHKPLAWAEEKGQIIQSLDPFIEQRMKERGMRVWRQQFASNADKVVRVQAICGRMAMGKVLFPCNAPWLQHVVAQLLVFPAGKHDDAVDVLGLFGRLLDQMEPARASKPSAPRPYNDPDAWMG